jgi:hypothetical protein
VVDPEISPGAAGQDLESVHGASQVIPRAVVVAVRLPYILESLTVRNRGAGAGRKHKTGQQAIQGIAQGF